MRIKPLRSMVGNHGKMARGVIVDVPDQYAQQLIKRGVAIPVQGKTAEATGKAVTRPPQPLPTGGQTGADKPSSSSAADRAPAGSTSRRQGKSAER